jgi:hypothetical protein
MKNSKSAFATPGQLRRRLTSALLTLGLIFGTIATTATPVEAATTVLACFTPYPYNYRALSVAVQLQVWNGADYSTIATGALSQGCVAWNIGPQYQNRYLRVRINDQIMYYGVYYWGETTQVAGPGIGPVFLQGMVNCWGTAGAATPTSRDSTLPHAGGQRDRPALPDPRSASLVRDAHTRVSPNLGWPIRGPTRRRLIARRSSSLSASRSARPAIDATRGPPYRRACAFPPSCSPSP